MKYPLSRVLGASLLAVSLAGCSSGGDSDGEITEASVTSVEENNSIYQGITTPINIDHSNANTLARVLFNGSNDTTRSSTQANTTTQSVSKQLSAAQPNKANSSYSTQAETTSEVNDPIVEVIYGSISGTNTVEDYKKDSDTGVVKFTFDEFNDGSGETIYGKFDFNIITYNATFDLITEAVFTYDELRTQTSTTDKVSYGTYKNLFNTETGTQTRILDLFTRNLIKDESIRTEGLIMELSVAGRNEDDKVVFAESISGRIFIRTLGYIDIETQQPLYCIEHNCSSSDYLASGLIQIRGANGSDLVISIMDDEKVRAYLDEDGDGAYESTLQFTFDSVGL